MKAAALALLTGALLLAGPARAQAAAAAPELKAQVLLKALRFVEWPAAALAGRGGLQLCLLVEGELARQLQALEGQRINQLPLQVRVLHNQQLGGCHLALVGPEGPWQSGGATLLVTETPGLLDRGAMLSLQVEEGRVVFDVELDAARRAGLEISARLLRLARFVKRSG
ncbi:YfiR family protein [Inhella proteolytica]|uniref:YfiR family protein n=1 Tax=Inhella proteolytica TaxID=2795029 RepID=A0A931NFY0_9BURK|nr:YfiR family protein [Inhella proteolytica]MBH9579302.1 YfiR family protein [Inhella proteolytica]